MAPAIPFFTDKRPRSEAARRFDLFGLDHADGAEYQGGH